MLAAVVDKDSEQMVELAEGIDEYQEQWDRPRGRLYPRPQAKKLCIADLCQAYEEATGTWTGCD